MVKEYISRKDLRDRGFTQPDSTFNPFHREINNEVAKLIENDLKNEIAVNYSQEMLREYLGLLDSSGFSDGITQSWLEKNISALREIEIEWREIVLHDVSRADPT